MTRASFSWPQVVRLVCALALALGPFARQAAIADVGAPNLSAYALPDGTLPVLCLSGSADKPKNSFGGGGCEFCRMASTVLLPEPPGDYECRSWHNPPPAITLRQQASPRPISMAVAPTRGPPRPHS